jgi:O-antigen ligase
MISKIALALAVVFLSIAAIVGAFQYVAGILLLLSIFLISFFSPSAGLLIFVASFPLFQFSIPGNIETSIPTVVGYSFFSGTLLGILYRKEVKLYLAPGSIYILLFLAAVAISTYFNFSYTVPHLKILVSYILLVIMYFLVVYVVRSEDVLRKVVITLIIVTFLICILVVYQYFTGQNKLFSPFTGYVEGRTYGVADPNYTAAFIITVLPLMVGMFFYTNSKWFKVVYLLQISLATFSITTTASRGGMIAVIVAFVTSLLVFIPPRKFNLANMGANYRRRVVALATGLVIVTVGLSTQFAPKIFWERAGLLTEDIQDRKSSRIEIWQDYLNDWKSSPWVGLGPGYISVYTDQGLEEPHNTLLNFLVQTGLLGTVAIMCAILLSIVGALRARKKISAEGKLGMYWLSSAVVASLIAFLAGAFFLSSASHKEFWLLLGLCGATARVSIDD